MSGDVCRMKNIKVGVQENGIIRDPNGWAMGRLGDDYPFEDIVEEEEEKLGWHKLPFMPFIPGLLATGAALIIFLLGMTLGHVAAMDQPCAAMCQVPESIR